MIWFNETVVEKGILNIVILFHVVWYSIIDFHLCMKYRDIAVLSAAFGFTSVHDRGLLQYQFTNVSIPIFLQHLPPTFFR